MGIENIRVAVESGTETKYFDDVPYHPPRVYPEHRGGEVMPGNYIYEHVRNLLLHLGLDSDHQGTPEWNPFGDFVEPGMTVFIKTNTVHQRHKEGKDVFSVIVHASIIRPILDYVVLALRGEGRIIIGDSQVYDALFDEAMKVSGIAALLDWYKGTTKIPIECFDLRINRATRSLFYGRWKRKKIMQDPRGYQIVDLGKQSYFEGIDVKKLRIGIASYRTMRKYHAPGVHQYLFPGSLIQSDVVINVPKLKTHRRTGITLAVKNFMGLPSLKDSLPHFTIGSPEEGGDQYIHPSLRKRVGTWLHDRIQSNSFVPAKFFFAVLKRLNWETRKIIPFKDDVSEAMWYGNDTVWRTLLDLNRAVLFADKEGRLREEQQRRYFCILDGIIGGDGNGPLSPGPVASGVLFAGYNPIAIDTVAATMMGFDIDKIRLITSSLAESDRSLSSLFRGRKEDILVIDDGTDTDLQRFQHEHNLHFDPHPGWVGHIERDDEAL